MVGTDSVHRLQCEIRGRNVAISHLQDLLARLDGANRDDTLLPRKINAWGQ